ncbi:MAG: helix-turn-helix transcriptional regulator [Clostridia bacterium]|nr:helix-turn-helix transcriptional regulator [Clostridia bacterium]
MDTIKIGKFIAENRKAKKLTQEQLAEKLGVTAKTISRWENGNYMPDISLLKPLSTELGVSLNDLLSGEKVEKEQYQEN